MEGLVKIVIIKQVRVGARDRKARGHARHVKHERHTRHEGTQGT